MSVRERLTILHSPDPSGQWCNHDGFSWPCTTARILNDYDD